MQKLIRQILTSKVYEAAVVFDEGICKFESGDVQIELGDEAALGLTHWTPQASGGQHEIALEVDPDRFFEHFFSVFE